MKSYQEFFNLTEENNKITKQFLTNVITSSRGIFSDVSNSGKAIIRVPSGTKSDKIVSVFKAALDKTKTEDNDITFSKITFKEKGRTSSGSDDYPSVVGGKPPKKGFSSDKDGFRIYITDKDDGGEDGAGGGKPKAADYESAICVEYNVKQLMSSKKKKRSQVLDEAMNIAFSASPGPDKKADSYAKKAVPNSRSESTLTKVGKAVALQLSGAEYFVHAGGSLPNTQTFYDGGSDNTPKSDIVGRVGGDYPRNYRYSLKKTGDKEGAQLMSGKRDESKGVFKASWDSWKVNTSSKQGIMTILNGMEKKLSDNIEITKGAKQIKKDLKTWLFETNRTRLISQVRDLLPSQVFIKNRKDEWEIVENTNKAKLNDEKILNFIQASFSMAGLLEMTKAAEGHLLHEVVRGQSNPGKMIDVVMGGKYTLYIRRGNQGEQTGTLYELYKLTLSAKESESVEAILDASIAGRELRDEISKFISKNSNIKRHIVFEAASGWYKFTKQTHPHDKEGKISAGTAPASPAVADSILEFNDGGVRSITPTWKYANEHSDLVTKLYVAFKGSGDKRYTSVRIPTESFSHENNIHTLIENSVSKYFDLLHEDLLMESLLGKVKDYAVGAWQQTKKITSDLVQYGKSFVNGIVDFSRRVYQAAMSAIKRVFGELYEVLSQGISAFLDFVGLGEPEGDFTISG
jgi:hypothetical protein